MNTTADHSTLYHLIRNYMAAMGTSKTTAVALKSYMDSVRRLRCTATEFQPLLLDLNKVIKNTEPKVIPLVHLIEDFETEMAPNFSSDLEATKARAIEILAQKLKQFEAHTNKLTANCIQCIAPNDFIIAHSPTAFIRSAFVKANTDKRCRFKVLVLKQDFLRTKELVHTFEQYHVEHLVIPEYNLSHYLDQVSKLFIGAVSLSADRKAVTGIGTANVVSLCHAHGIPVYLFAEEIKFAHTPIPNQHIYQEQQSKVEFDYTFHITTFSHDIVELKMIDHIITENGEYRLDH